MPFGLLFASSACVFLIQNEKRQQSNLYILQFITMNNFQCISAKDIWWYMFDEWTNVTGNYYAPRLRPILSV